MSHGPRCAYENLLGGRETSCSRRAVKRPSAYTREIRRTQEQCHKSRGPENTLFLLEAAAE
jgi:hypothetical protein